MLIDDLIFADSIQNITSPYLPAMQRKLSGAVKFDLAPDFAALSEDLGSNFEKVAHTLPFCRLPYKSIFIEVAQQVRPRFQSAGIHIPEIQKVPKRVGFLLEAMTDQYDALKAHQFWMFPDGKLVASELAMRFDPKNADPTFDTKPEDRGLRHFNIKPHPSWEATSAESRSILTSVIKPCATDFPTSIAFMFAAGMKEESSVGFEIAATDWSGEAIFLLAVLALVNTRNVVETELVPRGKLNKNRLRRGMRPLEEYHILKIHTELKKRYTPSEGEGGHRDLRWHLVMGHWKVRKTGVFFWHPHARGDKSIGEIHKDYEVTQ